MIISNALTAPYDIVGVAELWGETYVLTKGGLYRLTGASYADPSAGSLSLCFAHSGADEPAAFGSWGGSLWYATKATITTHFRIFRLDRDSATDASSFTVTTVYTDAAATVGMNGCVGFALLCGLPCFLGQIEDGGGRSSRLYFLQTNDTWVVHFSVTNADEYPDEIRKWLAGDERALALWVKAASVTYAGLHVVGMKGYFHALAIAYDDCQLAHDGECFAYASERTSDSKHLLGILSDARMTGGSTIATNESLLNTQTQLLSFIGETIDDMELALGCRYGSRFYFGARVNYDPGSGSIDSYGLLSLAKGGYQEESVFDASAPFYKPWAVVEIEGRDWLALLDDLDATKLYFLLDTGAEAVTAADHYSYRP